MLACWLYDWLSTLYFANMPTMTTLEYGDWSNYHYEMSRQQYTYGIQVSLEEQLCEWCWTISTTFWIDDPAVIKAVCLYSSMLASANEAGAAVSSIFWGCFRFQKSNVADRISLLLAVWTCWKNMISYILHLPEEFAFFRSSPPAISILN